MRGCEGEAGAETEAGAREEAGTMGAGAEAGAENEPGEGRGTGRGSPDLRLGGTQPSATPGAATRGTRCQESWLEAGRELKGVSACSRLDSRREQSRESGSVLSLQIQKTDSWSH